MRKIIIISAGVLVISTSVFSQTYDSSTLVDTSTSTNTDVADKIKKPLDTPLAGK